MSLEDAWPVKAILLGSATGIALGIAGAVIADHVLRRLTRWWQ